MKQQEITRTEATNLVEMYMKCTNNPLSQKGRKCKYTSSMKTFRDMTSDKHMDAVLVGKGPYDKHSENSDMFFNAIKELVDFFEKEEVYETQQRIIKTTMRKYCSLYCGEDEHCQYIICQAKKAVWFLSSAINNYFQQTHEYIKEALGDNTQEYNDCSVCKWVGTGCFYYSTIYGLNAPVCSECVNAKETEEFEKEKEKRKAEIDEYEGYVFVYKEDELEPQVCSVCDYNGCGSFYYSSDKMDEPVCHTCEMKYRKTADCSKRIYHDEHLHTSPQKSYEGYCYYPLSNTRSCSECYYNGSGFFFTEDNEVFVCLECGTTEKVSDDDYDYIDDNDSEYVPIDEEEDEEEDFSDDPHCQENDEDEDDDDPEKFFGCEGCQYEWRDGWKKGWKAAMKQIKKFAKKQNRPENIQIPECAYCGASHNLKRCAGTCEGAVRYCSKACQKTDWKEGHNQECCAKQ